MEASEKFCIQLRADPEVLKLFSFSTEHEIRTALVAKPHSITFVMILCIHVDCKQQLNLVINEPRHEKTGFLPMLRYTDTKNITILLLPKYEISSL